MKNRLNLLTGQDSRDPPGSLGSHGMANRAEVNLQDLLLEKHQGVESLILGGRRKASFLHEIIQKVTDVIRAQFDGMLLAMKKDVEPNPVGVGLNGFGTVVFHFHQVADLVQESRFSHEELLSNEKLPNGQKDYKFRVAGSINKC
jgi:hypothetical protein